MNALALPGPPVSSWPMLNRAVRTFSFATLLLFNLSAHAASSVSSLTVKTAVRSDASTTDSETPASLTSIMDAATSGTSRARTSSTTTTATATTESVALAERGPVHVGVLGLANEPAAISRSMQEVAIVPKTDVAIGYHFGPPVGWYELEGSTLKWHDVAPGDTHFLAVSVQDAADSRTLPAAKVQASITSGSGEVILSTSTVPMYWNREFMQFGKNISVSPDRATSLTLQVLADPPSFRRHDQTLGAFFPQSVGWTFQVGNLPEAATKPSDTGSSVPALGVFSRGRRPFAEPTPYPGASIQR